MRVAWVLCCVVLCGGKYSKKKRKKHQEQSQNTVSLLGTMWSTMESKKSPKTVIFPLPTFSVKTPIWSFMGQPHSWRSATVHWMLSVWRLTAFRKSNGGVRVLLQARSFGCWWHAPLPNSWVLLMRPRHHRSNLL